MHRPDGATAVTRAAVGVGGVTTPGSAPIVRNRRETDLQFGGELVVDVRFGVPTACGRDGSGHTVRRHRACWAGSGVMSRVRDGVVSGRCAVVECRPGW